MDSYYKLSLQIPRYVIALSAEWLSVEDVSTVQQLATYLLSEHEECKIFSGANKASTTSSQESTDVWLNIVAPNYQSTSDSSGAALSLCDAGWQRVHKEDSNAGDGGVGIDKGSNVETVMGFEEIKKQFHKQRSEMEMMPVAKMREFTGLVAAELNKIADELPAGGYLLDVVWLMPTTTDFPILDRCDAFMFSSLRRLVTWHRARVTIVLGSGVPGGDHPSLANWKNFMESQVVSLSDAEGRERGMEELFSVMASRAWHGQVKYISSRGTAFSAWPGFSLHRLADNSHRSEPFIEILNPSTHPGSEASASQQSLDDSFLCTQDLKSKYVVNETLEFIHLTDLCEIPSWFILPGKFELRLREEEKKQPHSRSEFWLRYLSHRLPADGQGAICQLSCLELEGPAPSALTKGLGTQAWTSSNPLHPPVPNVQLKGKRHTFFFLVHGDRKGRCIAMPLVSPLMLNGAAHAILAKYEEQEDTNEDEVAVVESAREVLDSIPLMSGRQLCEEEEQLARIQIKALAIILDKIRSESLEITVTPYLLVFLFNYMRREYHDNRINEGTLSHVATLGRTPSSPTPGIVTSPTPHPQGHSRQGGEVRRTEEGEGTVRVQGDGGGSEVHGEGEVGGEEEARSLISSSDAGAINLRDIPTELDQSPSEWMEREVLQNRESINTRLRRLKSDDLMLKGITVPPPLDTNTITLSAKEFLSHFKPNGQPRREDLVLAQTSTSRHSPRTRSAAAGHSSVPTTEELVKADFRTSIKLKHHGINYCLETPDGQSIDRRMVQLQQRCVRQEMNCTFMSHQNSTLSIRTKRKLSDTSSSDGLKAKVRKLSASAKKKPSVPTRQSTPRKASMTGRRTRTPSKGPTPQGSTTPRSRKKRPRKSSSGGLTPKRARRSTPVKTQPEEMTSPRRSARKLVREQQSSSTFLSPSSSTHVPTSARVSSTPSRSSSKRAKTELKDKDSEAQPEKSSASSQSRSERHKMKLRSIVEETLKTKGIDSTHPCFKACVTRLYTQTKMFVKDLKSSKGLYEEMKKIAEANADFVISFEQKRMAAKS